VCNIFGCNCDPCNCVAPRALQSVVASINATVNSTTATNATDCTDYYYYMNLTLAEKVARFEQLYCGFDGLTASDVMVRKIGNGALD
jgi:hypothetical protein